MVMARPLPSISLAQAVKRNLIEDGAAAKIRKQHALPRGRAVAEASTAVVPGISAAWSKEIARRLNIGDSMASLARFPTPADIPVLLQGAIGDKAMPTKTLKRALEVQAALAPLCKLTYFPRRRLPAGPPMRNPV